MCFVRRLDVELGIRKHRRHHERGFGLQDPLAHGAGFTLLEVRREIVGREIAPCLLEGGACFRERRRVPGMDAHLFFEVFSQTGGVRP